MRFLTWIGALALFVAAAFAADVNGKWKASYTTPNGQTRESTFEFKAEGETLTGTVSSPQGSVPIADGKVSGDDISFSVTRNFGGNEVKLLYKGKVSADELKLNVSFGERSFDITAKKVS